MYTFDPLTYFEIFDDIFYVDWGDSKLVVEGFLKLDNELYPIFFFESERLKLDETLLFRDFITSKDLFL